MDAFVWVVIALSVLGLLVIVVAPWRRVRAESGMDRDEEARLLLGEQSDDGVPGAAVPDEPWPGPDEEPA